MSVSNPLFPNVAKMVRCENCGYELPQELGQNDKNCDEWVASTLKKLPKSGITLGTIMDLNSFCRLCDVLTKLNRITPKGNYPSQAELEQKGGNKNG